VTSVGTTGDRPIDPTTKIVSYAHPERNSATSAGTTGDLAGEGAGGARRERTPEVGKGAGGGRQEVAP
jgi:hypothetical protein